MNTEYMEMPTPCQHCGEIFDLNDGHRSDKWYPNTVICEDCHLKEDEEMEEDDRWEDINTDISNALYELDTEAGAWNKVSKENQEMILRIAKKSKQDL